MTNYYTINTKITAKNFFEDVVEVAKANGYKCKHLKNRIIVIEV